jgi:hypothetical protein
MAAILAWTEIKKHLFPAPPPVVVPEAAAPIDPFAAIRDSMKTVNELKATLGDLGFLSDKTTKPKPTGGGSDDGPTTLMGDISKGLGEFHELMDQITATRDKLAAAQPSAPGAPEAATADPEEERQKMNAVLAECVQLVWDAYEGKRGNPRTTAERVLDHIEEKLPAWKTIIVNKLDLATVVGLLDQSANTEKRRERFESKRGKIWVKNFVKFLHGSTDEVPAEDESE